MTSPAGFFQRPSLVLSALLYVTVIFWIDFSFYYGFRTLGEVVGFHLRPFLDLAAFSGLLNVPLFFLALAAWASKGFGKPIRLRLLVAATLLPHLAACTFAEADVLEDQRSFFKEVAAAGHDYARLRMGSHDEYLRYSFSRGFWSDD